MLLEMEGYLIGNCNDYTPLITWGSREYSHWKYNGHLGLWLR